MFENDYKLDMDGTIKLVEVNKNATDRLFGSDDKNNIDRSKSVEVEKGALNNMKHGTIVDDTGNPISYSYFQVNGSSQGEIFEFTANNSRVEFGIIKVEDGRSYISTSHEYGQNAGITAVLANRNMLGFKIENITELTHSHPDGIKAPSGAPVAGTDQQPSSDVEAARVIGNKSPNAVFRIYTPSDKKYSNYDGNTTRPDLENVIVTPQIKKKG